MSMEHAAELPTGALASAEREDAEVVAAADERVATEVVSLRGMQVYLPEEPVLINGRPYGFKLNPEQLAAVVNKADIQPGWYSVNSLSMNLGSGLPAIVSEVDVPERIYRRGQLDITLPEALAAPKESDDDLRELAERSVNDQVKRGLLQSVRRTRVVKDGQKFFKGSLIVAPAVGVSVGLLAEAQTGERVMYGAFSAGGVAIAGMAASLSYINYFHKKVNRWAREASQGNHVYWYERAIDEDAFSNPLVELVPIEESLPTEEAPSPADS